MGVISEKGKPAPIGATRRWVVERTNSWTKTPTKSSCGVPRGKDGSHRLLGGLFQCDHHRGKARPRRLGPLPLGGSTYPTTMTYWRKLLTSINPRRPSPRYGKRYGKDCNPQVTVGDVLRS